jgi:hypothetical protein
MVPSQPVPNATPVNFKVYLALKHATIAPSVIPKMKLGYRIVLDAFLDNSKTRKAKNNAKNAPLAKNVQGPTQIQPNVWIVQRAR